MVGFMAGIFFPAPTGNSRLSGLPENPNSDRDFERLPPPNHLCLASCQRRRKVPPDGLEEVERRSIALLYAQSARRAGHKYQGHTKGAESAIVIIFDIDYSMKSSACGARK
jgi:hypothetical protein